MPNALPSYLTRIALRFFEELDTPFSLKAAIMLRYSDWGGLASLEVDPRSYTDASRYLRDNAAAAFLKKYEKLPGDADKAEAATVKWLQAEEACFRTNERLTRYLPEFRNSDGISPVIDDFLSSVRKIIRRWIGFGPPSSLEGRFGPGATLSDGGRVATVPHKMASIPTLTRGAFKLIPQWAVTAWGRAVSATHGQLDEVTSNRFTTVPKTALTDRGIAIEPSINVFYQLALGRELRRRLRYQTGWDLDHAQDIHRRKAMESSASREFATLDLSSASDTVCTTLVKLLLPDAWHAALSALRSPKTLIRGRVRVLEKFSSMGNGYTFELETIIFAALSLACTQRKYPMACLGEDVFVFGDDIIVRDDVVHDVVAVLRFCGFSLNDKKSFWGDVPFRESCGGDYFAGSPVRGFYLKRELNEPQDFISLANGFADLHDRAERTGCAFGRGHWFAVLDCIPLPVRRCRGPKGLGDLVIWDEECRWDSRYRNGIQYLRVFKPYRWKVTPFIGFVGEVVLASAVYGVVPKYGGTRKRPDPLLDGVIQRDGVRGYRLGWASYSSWQSPAWVAELTTLPSQRTSF